MIDSVCVDQSSKDILCDIVSKQIVLHDDLKEQVQIVNARLENFQDSYENDRHTSPRIIQYYRTVTNNEVLHGTEQADFPLPLSIVPHD